MRILSVNGQEGSSAFDVSLCCKAYKDPPEGTELMLSEYPVQYDRCSLDPGCGSIYPTLAAALRAYATEPSPWESVLRALIRRDADLYAPVRRDRENMEQIGYPCEMANFGTPLDKLFRWNEDSSAARTAADGWLRILASEGKSPSTYLEAEFILRAKDMHFTHPSISSVGYNSPRKLLFQFGDHPSVFWDWWIDPTSSTSILREEFACLITTPPDCLRIIVGWKENWLFTYPKWSNLYLGFAEEPEVEKKRRKMLTLADERAVRRMERKEGPRRVPGAWPV